MGEIIGGVLLGEFVESNQINLGKVGPNDKVQFGIKYLSSPDTIQYIEKGCGCTKAFFDFEANTITGELDISKTISGDFSAGETPIPPKQIFVWLNDGEDRYIADATKQRQINPKKSYFRITINGTVIK